MQGALDEVVDFMNNPRAFPAQGAFSFPVSPFPLFLRGKEGAAEAFVAALRKARIVSGGTASVTLGASLKDARTAEVRARNLLDRPVPGRLNGEAVTLPASAEATRAVPLAEAVRPDAVRTIALPLTFESEETANVRRDLSFGATVARRTAYDGEDPAQVEWTKHPALPLRPWGETPAGYGGEARLAWNDKGLFIRVAVRDATFVHEEFAVGAKRNANDCLQIGIDGYGDARRTELDGPGQDDYEYAVFPSADGTCGAILWANRVADRQITANTKEHGNCRIPDVTPAFARTADGCVYETFLPKARIVPGTVEPGAVVALGLAVHNADDPAATGDARVKGGLSFTGEPAAGHPQRWIEVLLGE